jgi:hypothetical protein
MALLRLKIVFVIPASGLMNFQGLLAAWPSRETSIMCASSTTTMAVHKYLNDWGQT